MSAQASVSHEQHPVSNAFRTMHVQRLLGQLQHTVESTAMYNMMACQCADFQDEIEHTDSTKEMLYAI